MVRIQHLSGAIDYTEAQQAYFLLKRLKWEDGIKSRKNGVTRKAKPLMHGDNEIVDRLIEKAVKQLNMTDHLVAGIYLNYYRTGVDYTPTHRHDGTTQMIISLGGDRTLRINNREIPQQNGDVTVFGSSPHGVPREDTVSPWGRISIACFLIPPLERSSSPSSHIVIEDDTIDPELAHYLDSVVAQMRLLGYALILE